MPTINYPDKILVGQEPSSFKKLIYGGEYNGASYGGPYGYQCPPYYQLYQVPKTKDNILAILSNKIFLDESDPHYVVHNNITNKDMMLFNNKVVFASKASASQSFVRYMKDKVGDFTIVDFKELVSKNIIEVKEFNK